MLNQDCQYDIIFGANFLDKFGFTINYNDNVLQWMDHEIPFKNPEEFFNNKMFIDLNNELHLNKEDNMFDQEILDNCAAWILNAKYEQVDTNRVAADQKQLIINQCNKLQHLLARKKKLFDGSLGVYPHQKVHIDLLPGWKPVHHHVSQSFKFTNKHSKRNSNTNLILEFAKNAEPQSGPCLASLLLKKMTKSDKSLISSLSTMH